MILQLFHMNMEIYLFIYMFTVDGFLLSVFFFFLNNNSQWFCLMFGVCLQWKIRSFCLSANVLQLWRLCYRLDR